MAAVKPNKAAVTILARQLKDLENSELFLCGACGIVIILVQLLSARSCSGFLHLGHLWRVSAQLGLCRSLSTKSFL